MKKTLLIMLIAICCIASVFATQYGKVVVGSKVGYLPQFKMGQFDATARWQMDFLTSPEFTTDVVCETGVMTDFKKTVVFDGFLGAGFTFNIAEGWNVYGNCGLDIMAAKGFVDLGLSTTFGFDYYVMSNLAVGANFKVAEYFKNHMLVYKPGIAVTYAF